MKRILIFAAIGWMMTLPGWAGPFDGRWKPDAPHQVDIFEGDIHILDIPTKPGSQHAFFTLIYDTQKHGLMCAPIDLFGAQYLCTPVILTVDKVGQNDRADLINAGADMMASVYVKGRRYVEGKNEYLDLSIHPMMIPCEEDDTCLYKKLPRYQLID